MGKINNSWYTSSTDEWATPQKVFDELNAEFHFSLDPCSSHSNHKVAKYYTIDEDGLNQNWGGYSCFVNPPFSHMKAWVKKCSEEAKKPFTKVVMLIPARTDTAYFHDYIYKRAEIRFIRGRLYYNDSKGRAPFPSMIVIF